MKCWRGTSSREAEIFGIVFGEYGVPFIYIVMHESRVCLSWLYSQSSLVWERCDTFGELALFIVYEFNEDMQKTADSHLRKIKRIIITNNHNWSGVS